MIEMGTAIFLGLVFIFIKLPRRTMLRLLNHDMAIDVCVTLVVFALHFGTFSGIMAATFAGLLTSLGTSTAKRLFGYIQGDIYHHGYMRLEL